ncbi:MAG TPA: M28 family peptidase [Levilinea sp.]|nr:M28 family peptidase [Levilinea sp.]
MTILMKRITIVMLTIAALGFVSVSCALQQPEMAAIETPLTPAREASPEPTQKPTPTTQPERFNGARAFSDIETQVALGPRLPGSDAHARAVDWMISELVNAGWQIELQETEMMGHPIRNVIGKRGQGDLWIVIGAHYDSRFWADEDPDPANHREPVPGANDGASGVAVLLELARTLPPDLENEIWLVFFDAEDQGNIPGWDWILGSRAFVESLEETPDLAIVVDMIGDADLNIYKEVNSDPALNQQIWDVAAGLGYSEQFIPDYKYSMLSDHTPFVEHGIPAVLLIDFDYPYWHTVADAPDKVSPHSLQAVGDTLTAWIIDQ